MRQTLIPRIAWWSLIFLAIVCHVRQYQANLSFWHDEASLVLNIRHKTAAQLAGALDYEQAAPPLFLWAQRGMYVALGGSEPVMRLVPFAAGILSILLFAAIANVVVGCGWGLLAVAIFGLSDMLIWHATEAKPYGTDVFVAVGLIGLALWCSREHEPAPGTELQRRRFTMLSAAAAIAVWFSYPAAMVFAALSLSLLPRQWRNGMRARMRWMMSSAVVALSFLTLLWLVVRKQQDPNLTAMWVDDFADLHHPLRWPGWLLSRLLGLCNYPLAVGGPLILIGAAFGAYALIRARRHELLGFLAGPLLVVILAATVRRYPFDGARLNAFLVPGVILLSVLGFQFTVRTWWSTLGFFAWVVPIALMGLSLYWATVRLIWPHARSNLRTVAAYVAERHHPDDGIYALDVRVWDCYWSNRDPLVRSEMDRADQIPFQRFWVIWSFSGDRNLHRADPLLAWLSRFASRRDMFIDKAGGAAFLFERQPGVLPAHLEPPNIETHHKNIGRANASD